MANPVVRLTANVSTEVAGLLDELAAELGSTKTEALNQAIVTAAKFYKETGRGAHLILQDGNVQREMTLPRKK